MLEKALGAIMDKALHSDLDVYHHSGLNPTGRNKCFKGSFGFGSLVRNLSVCLQSVFPCVYLHTSGV